MQNMKNLINKYNTDVPQNLRRNFANACSNPEFRNYVYKLNIPEDILMKFTSRLQECFNECKNCKNCKSLENCKNRVKGYVNTPGKNKNSISFKYVSCEKLEAEILANKYQQNIEKFDMPKGIEKASLKEIYKDDKARYAIIKQFKEFMDNYNNEEKPKGMYLHGSFGSGKSYLVAALFNEFAKKGVRSVLVYYPEFLRTLKASFQTDYSEKFNAVKKTPLLLLDDIGAENCSAWARDEVLGPILQYRMDENLPTFFTSNLTLEELETALSITSSGVDKVKARRIIERIKQLTIDLELISVNRRN